ncbi:hypothetical protein [Bradyrhizobium erythrophlei]|uniref:Uncharacterized protein n=1 Tax=Bradyrhizobium erythrophlei TaxID=1437360 RepID=A0A1M5SIC2_9BRAD|nr:hypothetical protein [Bradyrhizobium erythrophlei]SHH38241.1 hypothetical protein SAMN05443248_4619 [Bradyrhizobium erythrophlei]
MVTLTPEEMQVLTPEQRAAHQAAEDLIVFGQDAKLDGHGNYIEQGVGSPGRESINHLAAIRKAEGEDAYQAAVDAIWKRNPAHAERLGLKKRGKL